LALAYFWYAEPSPIPARFAERFRPLYEASLSKFRVDEAYNLLFVGPTQAAAVVCEFLDDYLVDRLVIGVAKLPRFFGRNVLARYQNGLVQVYVGISALSLAVLLLFFLLY
jgi:NADH-quinone oxidoreductase subunit L